MLLGELHRAQVAALARRSASARPADDAGQRVGHGRRAEVGLRISASSGTKTVAPDPPTGTIVTPANSGTTVSTARRTVCSMSAELDLVPSILHDRHVVVGTRSS